MTGKVIRQMFASGALDASRKLYDVEEGDAARRAHEASSDVSVGR